MEEVAELQSCRVAEVEAGAEVKAEDEAFAGLEGDAVAKDFGLEWHTVKAAQGGVAAITASAWSENRLSTLVLTRGGEPGRPGAWNLVIRSYDLCRPDASPGFREVVCQASLFCHAKAARRMAVALLRSHIAHVAYKKRNGKANKAARKASAGEGAGA